MGCTLVRLERIAGSKRALHSSVVQWNGCRGERWWQQVCKKWPWSGLQSFQGYAASLPLAFKISQHFQLLRKGINLEFQLYLYLQMHLEVQYIKCTQQRKSEIIRATLFVMYRKVASSRPVYYSIFEHFWGAAKGQLVSKCPFGVIVWTKLATKKFDNFCPGGQIKK